MKVIFLDVDGVLNTERYIRIQVNHYKIGRYEAQFNFDPIAMKNLKEIIDKTDARIVISSTWRLSKGRTHGRHWRELMNNLKQYGIWEKVIGITPVINICPRGVEIRKWLDVNKGNNIQSFVILDDDSDMEEFTETNLTKCDSKNGGITDEVKEKSIKILNS